MRLYAKIGTISGAYYDFRGDPYADDADDDTPPELLHAPKAGTKVSWQERKNGPWETGRVTDVVDTGSNTLFFIERF